MTFLRIKKCQMKEPSSSLTRTKAEFQLQFGRLQIAFFLLTFIPKLMNYFFHPLKEQFGFTERLVMEVTRASTWRESSQILLSAVNFIQQVNMLSAVRRLNGPFPVLLLVPHLFESTQLKVHSSVATYEESLPLF